MGMPEQYVTVTTDCIAQPGVMILANGTLNVSCPTDAGQGATFGVKQIGSGTATILGRINGTLTSYPVTTAHTGVLLMAHGGDTWSIVGDFGIAAADLTVAVGAAAGLAIALGG